MDQAPDSVNQTATPAEAKKGAAYGSILGIILIVAVLVVGAFYVWGERLKSTENTVPENGVRGEMLPDGSIPTTEGSASVRSGENGPEPI